MHVRTYWEGGEKNWRDCRESFGWSSKEPQDCLWEGEDWRLQRSQKWRQLLDYHLRSVPVPTWEDQRAHSWKYPQVRDKIRCYLRIDLTENGSSHQRSNQHPPFDNGVTPVKIGGRIALEVVHSKVIDQIVSAPAGKAKRYTQVEEKHWEKEFAQ